MLSRLATKEWFTARMSSASLISLAYPKLKKEQQEEQLQLFAQLCQDDTPMVRRVAAQYLGKMVENVVTAVGRQSLEEDGVAASLLIPLYEELASNEQPVGRSFSLLQTCWFVISPVFSHHLLFHRIPSGCKPQRIVSHLVV
jgi:hypothetical protein